MKLAAVLLALLIWCSHAAALPRGAAGGTATVTANAVYPLPILNYATNSGCATDYYVNASTGSDSYNGTSQTFTSGSTGPWATITHAEATLSGSNPGFCINVAPGTYAGDFQTKCYGNTNTYSGYCALRCAPNATTATARPYMYALNNGASGSLPGCKITNASSTDIQLGGIVATSGGDSSPYNYVIVDGFEITDLTQISSTITNIAYVSGTGLVTATIGGIAVTSFTYVSLTGVGTWTLASTPLNTVVGTTGFCISGMTGTGSIASANGCHIAASANSTTVTADLPTGLTMAYVSGGTLTPPIGPSMCMTIAGVTGTGSIAALNGYQCATTGTLGTTIVFPIATGLTLAYSSGGAVSTPDAHGSGSSVGTVCIGQGATDSSNNVGAHHQVIINNYIHDCGGAGIQTQSAALFFIVENLVVSNAWTSPYSESGIDITYNAGTTYPTFAPTANDGAWGAMGATGHTATIEAIIANNYIHNNGNPVGGTDGNDIIIDTNNLAANACATPGVTYGTLIYGNIGYSSGGRGTNMFNSSNVAVLNNTLWNNGQSVWNNNAPEGAGAYVNCGSNNLFKDNIGVAVAGTGFQADNYGGWGLYVGSTPGMVDLWEDNLFYTSGSPTACTSLSANGSSSSAVGACWNGDDTIMDAGQTVTAPYHGLWSGSTTYSGVTNNSNQSVLGSDGNIHVSISSSANLNHNPVSDAPTPGTRGTYWQNNGLPNNIFGSDPKLTVAGGYAPSWTLQSGSPALNASGADVTALGGYAVATPNIGAQ